MDRKHILTIALIAALALALAPRPGHTPGVTPPGTAVQAGYVVSIDPTTGEFTSTAPASRTVVLDESMRRALSTSSEGLREVPVSSGPGMMVHLDGRFQNVSVATVGDDDEPTVTCISGGGGAEGDHE